MGTGTYKRRCLADPFTCIKGYLHNPTDGKKLDVAYGCKCPDANGKLEPNCHTCDFKAGGNGVGECSICTGKTFLHDGDCTDSCEGSELAAYLPSGGKGGVCREAFKCIDGVDQSDGESDCACARKLGPYCTGCEYHSNAEGKPPSCLKCDANSKRPFLHDGECVAKCPEGNPAKDDESQGKQCS